MIIDIHSLDKKPDGEFYDKTQFFSKLKGRAISDEDFEQSKYLFQTLKMRNLSDMNDLYNFQDVALLCKIVENRCQLMQNEYEYSPRKCNLAST